MEENFFIPENYKLMFSSQDCSDARVYGGWRVDWESADNIPKCGLNLNYPKFEEIVWKKTYQTNSILVDIDIREVLDSFRNRGYDLDAWKYYDGRLKLSKNSLENPFFYPEVNLNVNNKFELGQGRHRLNILLNVYGIKTIKAEFFRESI